MVAVKNDNNTKVPNFGIRHIQSILLFMLITIAIGMRVQLSIALVAMTDNSTTSNPDVPVYDWTDKSTILSSFLWGYPWLQILAGNLGRIHGTKYFLLVSMTINSILSCLVPLMAKSLGSYGVMACRTLQGVSQGFFFPSINNLLSLWTPVPERARLSSFIIAGSPFGSIVTLPLVGYISATWYGWPFSFYLYGGLGFVWVAFYYFFGADSPDKHPSISANEKEYIKNNLDQKDKKVSIPWKAILTNVPLWAIWFSTVTQFWTWQTLLAEIPIYMNKIMKFDIKSNGLLSSVPQVASFIIMIGTGYLADYLINNDIISRIWTRKICTIIGAIIPGTAMLILAYIPEDAVVLSVILLVVAVGVQAFSVSGSGINHIDIAPSFAGVILGMINSCGSLFSIFGPMSVQFIVYDESNKAQWRIIFIMATVAYIIPAFLFLICASVDIQSFDPAHKGKITNKEVKTKKHSMISVISL